MVRRPFIFEKIPFATAWKEKQWFAMSDTFPSEWDELLFVISHQNITERKIIEEDGMKQRQD